MEYQDGGDSYFENIIEPGGFHTSDWDVDQFLEESTQRERERLLSELESVEELLEEREEIHSKSISEIESKLEWYQNRLQNAYRRNESTEKIERLKGRIRDFYREIREVRRERWLDTQELEEERRELLRELDELSDQELLPELLDT